MKTAIINGKEMTKEQLFDAVKNLRARDLIEKYLIPNGIKYNGSKTSLKESKQAVIDRMIKHFGLDEEETVEAVQQEVEEEFTDTKQEVKQDDYIPENPMSDEESELVEALNDLTEIYPDITVEEIGYRSYELRRGDEFIGVVTPCKDNVIIAFTAVEEFDYNAAVDKIAELVG